MEYRVSPNGWICTFLELKERLSREYQLDVKAPELIHLMWGNFKPIEIESEEDRKKIQEKYVFIYKDSVRTGFWDMLIEDTSDSLPRGHPSKLRYHTTSGVTLKGA